MTTNQLLDVAAFHEARVALVGTPEGQTRADIDLRIRVCEEETRELAQAFGMVAPPWHRPLGAYCPPDLDQVAHESCDVAYVAFGNLVHLFGHAAAQRAWNAVSNANMEKFGEGAVALPGGKVGKPPGWKKADVAAALKHRAEPCTLGVVDTVIYHGGCCDGYTAAYLIGGSTGPDVTLIPAQYGDSPPDLRGKNVLILDFCYPRAQLELIAQQAATLWVIDHHETNKRALEGFTLAEFDMNRSGAGMTRDWIRQQGGYVAAKDSLLADVVQDQDLWRFALPHTREFCSVLFSYEQTSDNWFDFAEYLKHNPQLLVDQARVLRRAQQKQVTQLAGEAVLVNLKGDVSALTANGPYSVASELGNLLAQRSHNGIGLVWRYDGDKVRCSIRSTPDGPNVALIAEQYGGGGHEHAAGFEITLEELAELLADS